MFTPKYRPRTPPPHPSLSLRPSPTARRPSGRSGSGAGPGLEPADHPAHPGSALALAAGGGAVVLVVGAVLVSMLLAVAITAMSVAVVAVVLKSLLKDLNKQR
ncbi:SpdD protein [Streptomyces sp. T1317-0309]|nr:SpdD protein [Streptomyces sp. T1317-0309]